MHLVLGTEKTEGLLTEGRFLETILPWPPAQAAVGPGGLWFHFHIEFPDLTPEPPSAVIFPQVQ